MIFARCGLILAVQHRENAGRRCATVSAVLPLKRAYAQVAGARDTVYGLDDRYTD